MKILIILLSIISIRSYANNSLDKIQGMEAKFLFVVENDIATNCFKSNAKSIEALKTYKLCDLTPNGRQSPLEELKAECSRDKNTFAYFFNSKKSCNNARLDMFDNGL